MVFMYLDIEDTMCLNLFSNLRHNDGELLFRPTLWQRLPGDLSLMETVSLKIGTLEEGHTPDTAFVCKQYTRVSIFPFRTMFKSSIRIY